MAIRNTFEDNAKLSEKFKTYAKDLTILFAEDDAKVRENVEYILKKVFKNVVSATDGQDGVERFKANPCDIILTDINMPRMNGVEMIKEIREEDPEIPIIILSAHDESQYYLELINLGVDGYILKPMNVLLLIYTLSKSCKALYDARRVKTLEREVLTQQNRTIAMAKAIEEGKDISRERIQLLRTSYQKVSASDFVNNYPTDLQIFNDKLEVLDEKLDIHIDRFVHKPEIPQRDQLASFFMEIAHLIATLPEFANLATAIDNFATTLGKMEDFRNLNEAEMLLFGIASGVAQWRQMIFVAMDTEDIHYLDASLISDCIQLESVLTGQMLEDTDDIEFF